MTNTIIVQAQAWKEKYGQAGKDFLDVYSDGVRFGYYKSLGFSSMEDCTKSVAIEYGWSKSIAAAMAVEVLPKLEAEARERQAGGQGGILLREKLPQAKSTDIAGEQFGVSGRYVRDAKKIKLENPELFEQIKNGEITLQKAKIEQETIVIKKAPVVKNWMSLSEFEDLSHPDSELTFMSEPESFISVDETKTMNLTKDNVEWAKYTWNPITGCLHNCAYCYARDIANLRFNQGFEPAYLPERLAMPRNTKVSDSPRWDGDIGFKNVFTCSMADLFGKWVPEQWIKKVLEIIKDNPQWTFLLLTKFPIRMADFSYPDNVWLGTTVDYQHTVVRAETAFIKIKESGFNGVCWLSCEPMMERLTFSSLDMFDWVVMGGSSTSTQTPEYRPPFEDILHLHIQARQSNCKIYQKTNLIPGMSNDQRIREYP